MFISGKKSSAIKTLYQTQISAYLLSGSLALSLLHAEHICSFIREILSIFNHGIDVYML